MANFVRSSILISTAGENKVTKIQNQKFLTHYYRNKISTQKITNPLNLRVLKNKPRMKLMNKKKYNSKQNFKEKRKNLL